MSTNTKMASVRAIKAALRDICETLKVGSYPKAHEIEEALSLVAAHDAEQAQQCTCDCRSDSACLLCAYRKQWGFDTAPVEQAAQAVPAAPEQVTVEMLRAGAVEWLKYGEHEAKYPLAQGFESEGKCPLQRIEHSRATHVYRAMRAVAPAAPAPEALSVPITPAQINELRDRVNTLACLSSKAERNALGSAIKAALSSLLDGAAPAPEALAAHDAEQAPIDMVLHCPKCGKQHIDEPEEHWDRRFLYSWGNPPHRSHLCHGCGHIWRPADVPTNGVEAVKTKGKADSPIAAPVEQAAQAVPSEVWEAASKTASMLFHTRAEANAWLSQFAPSVAGGFEIHRRDVYHYPAAPAAPAPEAQAAGQEQDERAVFESAMLAVAGFTTAEEIAAKQGACYLYHHLGYAEIGWQAAMSHARAALAQRQPLTDERVEQMIDRAFPGSAKGANGLRPHDSAILLAYYRTGLRDGETEHGIGATTGEQQR